MTKATKKDVVEAFDFLIVEWRERQNDVLREVPFPTISYDANAFKSMGWLNFGMDFTDTVFPNSAVNQLKGQVMSRLTIPLWVLGKAQSALEAYYQQIRNNHQRILESKYMTLRDNFIKKISAISATFIDDPYGRQVVDHVFKYVNKREFKDDQQKKAFLRRLIYHANLVETDPDVLREKINPRFQGLMKKIKYLWLASHHTPTYHRYNLEFRANRGERYQHIMKGSMRNKETQQIIDQIIASAWGHDVRFVASKKNVLVMPSPGKGISAKPTIFKIKSFKGESLNLSAAETKMYMGENEGPLAPWEFRKNMKVPA